MEQWRRPATVLAALALVLLSACTGGGSDTASTASTTVPGVAGTTPAPDACKSFRGSTAPRTSGGPVAAGFLIGATAGGVGCLDKVEFTFNSVGDGTIMGLGLPPSYTVEYKDDGHFMDGDTAISVDGEAWLLVTMKPASSYEVNTDPTAKKVLTYTGNTFLRWSAYNHLQVVRRLEDVQDSVQWVISLNEKRPFAVDAARDPTRITIWIG